MGRLENARIRLVNAGLNADNAPAEFHELAGPYRTFVRVLAINDADSFKASKAASVLPALSWRSTLPDANVADTVGVDVEAARLSIAPAQLEAHGLPPVSPRRPALELA